jgi:hypothetical protein
VIAVSGGSRLIQDGSMVFAAPPLLPNKSVPAASMKRIKSILRCIRHEIYPVIIVYATIIIIFVFT